MPIRRKISGLAAGLLLLPLAAPTGGAEFVADGSILGGATPFSGWSQASAASVPDAGAASQPQRDIVRFHAAWATTSGGTQAVSASNPLQHAYLRIDHNGTVPDPTVNWNVQLNLGDAPAGKADHLLQMRVTSATAIKVRLHQYDVVQGTYPLLGAFTTNRFSLLFSNLAADPAATQKAGIQVRTGQWNGNAYGFEVGIPMAWLQDSPTSHVRADGSGSAAYVVGAAFSSGGAFGAVSTVYDELGGASGILAMVTSTATGATSFEAAAATRLAFATQPANAAAGAAIPTFTVEVRDAANARVAGATHLVTVAILNDPTGQAVLSGTRTVAASDGTATFSGLSIDRGGAGYTLRAAAGNLASADSAAFSVLVASVSVGPDPVAPDGSAQAGSRWGAWTATPGDAGVASGNYLKVQNTGQIDATAVTVDFTPSAFAGASDPDWTIPIDGNIQFACAASTAGQPPSALSFAFAAVSGNGSATCTFPAGSSGGAGTMYVRYRIAAIPSVAWAQDYQASYTVTVST